MLALQALAELCSSEGPAPRLLIVGSGPTEATIRDCIRELNLEAHVLMAGQRNNPYSVIKHADGLLLCSTHEGQPMVFLEAMTVGTPIASTDIAAAVAVLQSGRLGLLVPQTKQGVIKALSELARGRVSAAVFDPRSYVTDAIERFKKVVLR